jgi:general secretion pathway protein C
VAQTTLSLASLRDFDFQQLLNRIARRQNIEYMVRGTKGISALVMVSAIGVLLYIGTQETLERRSQQIEFEGRIQAVRSIASEHPAPTKENERDLSLISHKNVFGTLGKVVVQPAAPTPPPQTPLSLTLIGTFLTKGQEPYAIIEDKKKQSQDVFSLEQSIFGQATLKQILEDHVEIERDGKREILKLDDLANQAPAGAGVSSVGSDEFIVEEAELDKGLENLPLLLTQARAVPYFKEGRSIGLRLFAIKNGSLYEKIGLKNGDILKSINGNSLGDISQALKLFEQLKQERSINLVLEREKQDREFKYTIR